MGIYRLRATHFWVLIALTLNAVGTKGWAGNSIDRSSQDALLKTLETLTQPQLRNQAIQQNPNAQLIDQQIKTLAGSEANTQQIYELAAEIFQTLTENSGGDPHKILSALENAKNNPKVLFDLLTPAQKAKLKNISQKIEPTQKGTTTHPAPTR